MTSVDLARADFLTRKIGGQMVNGHIFLIKRNKLNSNRQAPGRKRIGQVVNGTTFMFTIEIRITSENC
jgi:hypothetical protein